MRPMNMQPGDDGDVTLFDPTHLPECAGDEELRRFFNPRRSVIFINGMGNDPESHRTLSLELAKSQMCRVVGVFNRKDGFFSDLLQCVSDKHQFHSLFARSADRLLSNTHPHSAGGRDRAMLEALRRNRAAVALYDLLLSTPSHVAIFAHSQGNIILCNTLHALDAAGHGDLVRGRKIYSSASPVRSASWPANIHRQEYAFTWDAVVLLTRGHVAWSTSSVGMPLNSRMPITHAFLEYLKRQPDFIINEFRTSVWKLTLSVDEAGLARRLAGMGRDFRMVDRVLARLESLSSSDAPEVAARYVNLLADLAMGRDLLRHLHASAEGLAPRLINLLSRNPHGRLEGRALDALQSV